MIIQNLKVLFVLYSIIINCCSHLCRQRLLVLGGGGAVGFAAVQFSVASGCHVTATCGSKSIDRVLAAGAEQAVDYSSEVINFELLHPIFFCF